MGTTDRFDSDQYLEYRKWGIRLQEELFGQTFTTTGGEEMTERLVKTFKALKIKPGQAVIFPFKIRHDVCSLILIVV